jgi:hypothetical protein
MQRRTPEKGLGKWNFRPGRDDWHRARTSTPQPSGGVRMTKQRRVDNHAHDQQAGPSRARV